MQKHLIALIASISFAGAACAQVTVSTPWVRATVPAMKATGAFMRITSARDARLVGVKSPAARAAEIHQMAMKGDQMNMQQVEHIDLPAGKAVDLASGGYHIMLVGLKQQLKDGQTIPLTLTVEYKDKKRENLDLKVPVKPLTYAGSQH